MNPLYLNIIAIAGLTLYACSTSPGLSNRGLSPCPDKPNCVSSQSSDKSHAITPLTYTGSPDAALKRLVTLVAAQPRTKLITEEDDYLHFEFRSKWFRFVDDVEFWLPKEQPGIIHIRSASRLGYSDLGVNRKRMEQIREVFSTDGK